jgi:type I restriction enzyme R subunit
MLTLLTDLIEKYENNVISSAEIIKHLLEIADEIKKLDEESKELGLSEEEVVFYDTLAADPATLPSILLAMFATRPGLVKAMAPA